ncbi:MAG: hypothetical protein S4CHLAM81_06610 [Chlamydiales bacterium]|nr:hypothetical protein [Chlamydiales bacterium]MCH9635445.1 hypothetical protein [Chlamydiales bacterium]MCH9703620.1 DUF2608 domain-containing protein [Chlamydiota bacterium]
MGNFICQLACLLGAIFQTDCLQTVEEESTPQTLCFFDVDMVLIQPSNPAFQIPNMKKHNYKRIVQDLTDEQNRELWTQIATSGTSTLVQSDAPCIIRRLKNRGIAMAGLTKTLTKDPYEVNKLERLKRLGFYFPPLCSEEIIFSNLEKFNSTYPTYRQGVLFANDTSKGAVAVDFIRRLDLHPKKIIFVDDHKHNLEDVEEALAKMDSSIEYVGYLYRAAWDYPSEEISQEKFDEEWQILIDKIIN